MKTQTQVDLNQAQCIQSISNFGETIYTNICSGVTTSLQWGTADWAAAVFLCFLVAVIFVAVLGFAVMVIGDL